MLTVTKEVGEVVVSEVKIKPISLDLPIYINYKRLVIILEQRVIKDLKKEEAWILHNNGVYPVS